MDRIFLPFCQFEFSFLRHAFRCSFIVQVGKAGLAVEVSSNPPLVPCSSLHEKSQMVRYACLLQ